MKPWTKMTVAGGATVFFTLLGCGGDTPAAKPPEPMPSATAAPSAEPSASVALAASSAAAVPPAPPAMKGTVHAFAHAASSGTVDKIGEKDGNLKPDGVKDVVFDLDYEGAATAMFVMTTDDEGTLTSEFDADSLVGDQVIPKEVAGIRNTGKTTAGLAIYDGDKLLNGKDGGLEAPLPEGRHKLTLRISSKSYPKSPVRVFVLLPDGTLVKGPMIPVKGPAAPAKGPTTPAK